MSPREIGWSDRGRITGSCIKFALYRVLPSAMLRAHQRVGRLTIVVTLWASALSATSGQTAVNELAQARAYYNQRQFDEAIAVASAARKVPEAADAAALVLARAHLERYRERADPADLSAAREVLGGIRAGSLEARDQVELLLALGQSLFLEDDFGASAELFESGIERAVAVDRELGEAMLEWWGSAVERLAGGLTREPRTVAFSRVVERMREELARRPSSAAACYWTAAALRGAGDPERAWDAAVAGWVRARLMGDGAASLRADLDRLVLRGIIPDRVRPLAVDQQTSTESQLKADWELVKERWK